MKYGFNFLLITFISCIFFSSISFSSETPKIYCSSVENASQTYYHIKYKLTPENTVLYYKGEPKPSRYSDYDGKCISGSFHVYIPKKYFPINAPNAAKYIIVGMGGWWTGYDKVPEDMKKRFIKEKEDLFNKIVEMKKIGKGEIEVVIELNPYCTVLNENPLEVRLDYCNAAFRTAYGKYIDYVGPLKNDIISIGRTARESYSTK